MNIVIENPETGEELILEPDEQGKYPNMRVPWRVKGTTQVTATNKQSVVAPMAYKAIGRTLHAVGRVLGANCSPCNLRYYITQHTYVLGIAKANEFIKRSFQHKANTPEFEALVSEVKEAVNGQAN